MSINLQGSTGQVSGEPGMSSIGQGDGGTRADTNGRESFLRACTVNYNSKCNVGSDERTL